MRIFGSRFVTTTSHPRHALDISARVKEETQESGGILHSSIPDLEIPNKDIFSFFYDISKSWQHKTFTECGLSGKKYTYGQTMDSALRWGEAVKKILPNSKNPTIAFICPNSPDYICLFLGTLAAGGIVSPLNPLYTPGEAANQIRDSGAELLVVDPILEPLADAALKVLGKPMPIVVNGVSSSGRPNAQEVLVDPNAKMLDFKELDPNSVAFLPYSSGTTGNPKGVKLSHNALAINTCMVASEHFFKYKGINRDNQEVQIGILPLFHIYGVAATLMPGLYLGSKIITMPKFDPNLFISLIKSHGITTLQTVPSLSKFIASCDLITKEDLKSIHSIGVGGSPLSTDVAHGLKNKAPTVHINEGFGMTETLITHTTPILNETIGSSLQLLSNAKAKVVDLDTREMLPPNTPGELIVQSPSSMLGYHNNEEATKETMDEEGWVRTGDIAVYTEEGFFSIIDRIKELIKVKSLQVSPTEIEETLQKHPGVAEAGVVGVPNDQLGEAPLAFIIKSDPDVSEKDIHSFMEKNLAKHKQLAGGIKFVDELPKNATGKLLRRILKSSLN
ncbi:4-coumarate--CoA ligase-like 7 [Armadillidium vulgare]|nr:4-coumarate--CoA ligase-like 7 [Armadillidium vulgare]